MNRSAKVVLVRQGAACSDQVRFSWFLQGPGAGRAQTAYQLRLTQDDAPVGDSGRVESDRTTDIAYGGPPLGDQTRYRWKVQAWDETGAATGWSAPAAFETGFSDQTGGFHASWITLGRVREDFRPPSEPGPSDPGGNVLGAIVADGWPAKGPSPWPATLAPLVPPKRSSRSGRARTSSPAPTSPVIVV